MAEVGTVVKPNETALVVLNQLEPIYVTFSVPEEHLPRIQDAQAGGALGVAAQRPQEDAPLAIGELAFIDNKVDDTTGMVLLKATFANAQRRLWPGQSLDAVLTLAVRHDVVVVPSQAVQLGQSAQFVYVLRDDDTVEARPVEPGTALNGVTVIERGLAAGERVVTNGQLRLTPGAKVQIKTGAAATSAPAVSSQAARP